MPSKPNRRDTPPPAAGKTELEVLLAFLDYLRASAAGKLAGLNDDAARMQHVVSGTTMLGLVRHLTYVERFMFLRARVVNWKATFRPRNTDTVESITGAYRHTVDEANTVIASWDDLAVPAPRYDTSKPIPSRRWVLTHMIEETGRHAGHLDILREITDGSTGR